jgi:hypothetical protein
LRKVLEKYLKDESCHAQAIIDVIESTKIIWVPLTGNALSSPPATQMHLVITNAEMH